jgi:hypothetical protein
MNNNTALTLTSKHTYLPSTKPPPILLGLVDSLENSVQNNVYFDGEATAVIAYQHKPWKHVYRGTLVTITIPHNARLVVWVG